MFLETFLGFQSFVFRPRCVPINPSGLSVASAVQVTHCYGVLKADMVRAGHIASSLLKISRFDSMFATLPSLARSASWPAWF